MCHVWSSAGSVQGLLGTNQVGLDDANLTLLLIVRLPFPPFLGVDDRIYLRLAGESDMVICGKCFQGARDPQVLCVAIPRI